MERLSVLSSVRCLGCGTVYAKPASRGTAAANPGCPKCGYVGWAPDEEGVTRELERFHFAADRPLRRFWQSD
jgi:predicted  nucleic acid-binding Zn-ribbon protein